MSFITTVETDLKTWLGDAETIVEEGAETLWGLIKAALLKATPSQWTILSGLFQTAATQIEAGDIVGMVESVLQQAETQELAWVKSFGTAFLTAAAALFADKASAASAPGA